MELLPPVGWADIATKQDITAVRGDLEHLGTTLRLAMANMELRFDAKLEHELREQMNRFSMASSIMLGIVVAVPGVLQTLLAVFT